MAENKTKDTDLSIIGFLESIDSELKKRDAYTLMDIMKDISNKEPKLWGSNLIGFGSYIHKYDSGQSGTSFPIGFSPRKERISIYFSMGFNKLQPELSQLGKYKFGRGCLYVNKLSDINLEILQDMLRKTLAK